MLSAQTYQTYLTDKQRVIDKQGSSDALANPSDIQIDFAENQPAAFKTTSGAVGTTTNPQNAVGAAAGKNPFDDKDMDEDEGDLNLTENSVHGPSARGTPQENQPAANQKY